MIEFLKIRFNTYKNKKETVFEDLAFISICLVLFLVPFSAYIVKRALYVAIVMMLVSKGIAWPKNKNFISKHFMNRAWLVLVVIFALVSIVATQSYESWKFLAERFLMYVFAFWLTKELVVSRSRLNVIITVMLSSITIVGLDCLYQFFTGKDFFFGHPVVFKGKALTGPLPRHNYLSGYLEIVIPFVVFVSLKKRKIFKIIAMSLLSFLLFFVLIYVFKRGSILSVFLAVFSVFFFLKKRVILLAPVLALVFFLVMPLEYKHRFTHYLNFKIVTEEDSGTLGKQSGVLKDGWLNGRRAMWKVTFDMFKEKPLFGHGLFAYNLYHEKAKDRKLSSAYAHNTYFQLAAETGIIGLTAFLFLLGTYFFNMFKFVIRCKDYNQRALICAFIASSLSVVIAGLYSSNMIFGIGFSLMFWIIMATGSNLIVWQDRLMDRV